MRDLIETLIHIESMARILRQKEQTRLFLNKSRTIPKEASDEAVAIRTHMGRLIMLLTEDRKGVRDR